MCMDVVSWILYCGSDVAIHWLAEFLKYLLGYTTHKEKTKKDRAIENLSALIDLADNLRDIRGTPRNCQPPATHPFPTFSTSKAFLESLFGAALSSLLVDSSIDFRNWSNLNMACRYLILLPAQIYIYIFIDIEK